MSSATPADWVFGFRTTFINAPCCFPLPRYRLWSSSHQQLQHLRSLSSTVEASSAFYVSAESIVIIYCSYCAIYADLYCQTQEKELFACCKVCTCVSWYFLYWVWEISQNLIFYFVLSLRISQNLFFSWLSLRISHNFLFCWLNLRISQNLQNLHFTVSGKL